jgi:hypothetical protein
MDGKRIDKVLVMSNQELPSDDTRKSNESPSDRGTNESQSD